MKINGNSKKSTASRAAAGTGRKRGGKKRGGAAGTAGVTLIILAVLIAAAVAGTGFYVKSRDTIFPNVSVGDVRVGGLTVEAAKTALLDAGYETDADNVSVTVTLPNNDAIEIPGAEAGLRPHADEAAQRAFEHGRDAGLLGNELSFIKSLFTPTAIDDADFVELDRDFVRAIVSEHVSKFNDSLTEGSYKIDEQGISITKGAGSAIADVDAVFTLTVDSIMQSLDARSPVSAEYNLPPAGDDVDLVALFNNVNVEPVSAVYDAETKTVTQSVTGISFDMASARRALELAESGATVTVPLIRTEPEVTTESLTSLLFRDIISERTTNIAGTSNRLNNVTLAAEAINGLILNPGETFSFNESVGQRTSAKG
ncbi:MAG: VanW family protein, partial [Oscillospiraceae bacterium]|nr:VanW family protein [Oscillospiraceae bacterium]